MAYSIYKSNKWTTFYFGSICFVLLWHAIQQKVNYGICIDAFICSIGESSIAANIDENNLQQFDDCKI